MTGGTMPNTIELTTPYGTIEVVPQSDLDLYLPGSELHFTLSPRFSVRVSGHLSRTRRGGSWVPYKATWQVKRTDSSRDATTRMALIALGAVQTAVDTIGEDVLAAVQAAKRTEQARDREDLAADLRDLAYRLTIEAEALRAGGREEYHDHYHAAGFTETGVRHVRTREGVLLPSLPEVKVYASHKYGPRLPGDRP